MRTYFTLFLMLMIHCISSAQFKYLNPLPGSKYKNPETSIILKNGSSIDHQSVKRKDLVEIYGSKSGKHNWTARLSDDNKTVIIKPNPIFECGETVTVTVHPKLRKTTGEKIEGTTFSFYIREEITPEQQEKYRQSRLNEFIESFGYDPTAKSGTIRDYPLDSMPSFTINVNDGASPGKVFYNNQYDPDDHDTNSFPTIIENDGTIYWAKDLGRDGHDFKINYNGDLTYYTYEGYTWMIMDSSFTVIDSVTCGNGYAFETNGHEFLMYPNGHMWLMAYNLQTLDMTQYGGVPNAIVKGLIIQEMDANKDVIFEWSGWDHFELDDAMPSLPLTTGEVDYTHGNSIELDTDDNILISSRNLSELSKIDHGTGEFIWRMGGENNQFTFVNDNITEHFDYQHDLRRLPNGNISIFNNCNNCAIRKSEAKEYKLDEVNKVATLVWHYAHPDVGTEHVYGRASGNAQKLPNGNWFINWGLIFFDKGLPSMTEVDSLGNILWEMTLDSFGQKSYRAHRYLWEPCGLPADSSIVVNYISVDSVSISWGSPNGASSYDFQYKIDTAINWIDIPVTGNSIILDGLLPETIYDWRIKTYCETFNGDSSNYSPPEQFNTIGTLSQASAKISGSMSVYPNPSSDLATIIFDSQKNEVVNLSITNLLGASLEQQSFTARTGMNRAMIDLHGLPKGPYLIELTSRDLSLRCQLIVD